MKTKERIHAEITQLSKGGNMNFWTRGFKIHNAILTMIFLPFIEPQHRTTGVRICVGMGQSPESLVLDRIRDCGRGHSQGSIFHFQEGHTEFREYSNLDKSVPISLFHNPIFRIVHYWNRHL